MTILSSTIKMSYFTYFLKKSTLLLFSLLCVTYSCAVCAASKKMTMTKKSPYVIIIDAGSSGSRVYIYKVEPKSKSLPDITLVNNGDKKSKVSPGISEFENNERTGKQNIKKLLQRAKDYIESEFRDQTPLYLLATAGMRLYSKDKRNRIFNKVSDVIKNENQFNFKMAKTISGRYEGLYGWLAINYLDDRFSTNPSEKREGLLEMGGASTQITYVPKSPFKENKLERKINGKLYPIYSKSFLYMGINEVTKTVTSSDCYSVGYDLGKSKKGAGNFTDCSLAVTDRFDALCENIESKGPHCIFSTLNFPSTDNQFIAVSAFYYTLSVLGFHQNISFDKLKSTANSVCTSNVEELLKKYPKAKAYLNRYCLETTYYWLLFKKAYRFSENNVSLSVKNKIRGTEISWTLGAVLDIEMGYIPETYSRD